MMRERSDITSLSVAMSRISVVLVDSGVEVDAMTRGRKLMMHG